MKFFVRCWLIAAVIWPCLIAAAQTEYTPKYSSWEHSKKHSYFWQRYDYKPGAYHYLIYHPSRGKKVYHYDPEGKRYLGYYDMERMGYAVLPPQWQLNSSADIPLEAYLPLSKVMPLIPGESIRFSPPVMLLPQLKLRR